MMTDDSRIERIARQLRAWGLNALAASLLENASPLAFLGAQALYFVGPTLAPFAPGDEVTALAQLLEDPARVRTLVEHLDEPSPSPSAPPLPTPMARPSLEPVQQRRERGSGGEESAP